MQLPRDLKLDRLKFHRENVQRVVAVDSVAIFRTGDVPQAGMALVSGDQARHLLGTPIFLAVEVHSRWRNRLGCRQSAADPLAMKA